MSWPIGSDHKESTDEAVVVTYPQDDVALITLNRPAKLNPMNQALIDGIYRACDEIDARPQLRVAILTGAGRGFCAGSDLTGFGGDVPGTEDAGDVQKYMGIQQKITGVVPRIQRLKIPVIAAVNGPAAGGGFALVLACDVRIAARSARFNVAFIRIGLSACDIGTSWLLPRIVGAGRAHELMLTGRIFDAAEAERIGLVTEVVPDDTLLDAALAKADEIRANSPWAVFQTKEVMWSALEIPGRQAAADLENRTQVLAGLTADATEAMRAFLEKRPPDFKNA
ncbi:MAG: enoyl-CoA hydratase/isomerase family protein [Actinobacteria bacterium]|nr:enoyl-CoA hydratase/isomerase family protein [Actinomycetota bacterium]